MSARDQRLEQVQVEVRSLRSIAEAMRTTLAMAESALRGLPRSAASQSAAFASALERQRRELEAQLDAAITALSRTPAPSPSDLVALQHQIDVLTKAISDFERRLADAVRDASQASAATDTPPGGPEVPRGPVPDSQSESRSAELPGGTGAPLPLTIAPSAGAGQPLNEPTDGPTETGAASTGPSQPVAPPPTPEPQPRPPIEVRREEPRLLVGSWQGSATLESVATVVEFVISETSDGQRLEGIFRSPNEGISDTPVNVAHVAAQVTLTVPGRQVEFVGRMEDDAAIRGTYTRGAASAPLVLVRRPSAPTAPTRLQIIPR
jgi:hypothetical protein